MDFYESFVEPTQTFVTSHGWSLLFGSIVGWLVWKLASPRVHGWRKEREDREWEEAVYGNPEEVARRQEALARARAKQQEEYEKKAKAHAEKMKEREEQQRAEAVSEWDKHREGRGYRSKVKPSASQEAIADRAATELTTAPSGGNETCSRPPRRLRPEYNPLMGQGASRFTPAPRGNFSGG